MEERKTLLKKMQDDNTKRGFSKLAKGYKEKVDDLQIHVDKLKEVLFASQKLT
jgi:two-component system, chemotaxis family, protein-glutamate methylesterase/glutaminase